MVDKNQAVINFILTCPAIAENPVYFNAIKAQDKSKGIITVASDRNVHKPFIDGSVQKRYTFTIIDFRSISYNPLIPVIGTTIPDNENVTDMLDVQGVMDWINEQNDLRNFPNFGEDYFVDSIWTATDNPNLNGVDTSLSPSLAKYSFSIQIEYIDNSKRIF